VQDERPLTRRGGIGGAAQPPERFRQRIEGVSLVGANPGRGPFERVAGFVPPAGRESFEPRLKRSNCCRAHAEQYGRR